jgi:hypothetical protein
VPQSSVHSATSTKLLLFKPYRLHLQEVQCIARVQFSKWFSEAVFRGEFDPDEAWTYINGQVKNQNNRRWLIDNPRALHYMTSSLKLEDHRVFHKCIRTHVFSTNKLR